MDTIDTENRFGITFCDRLEIAFTHGEGSRVLDEQGKVYLDFTSGWGVTCLGHSHPAITRAITEQAQRIIQSPNAGFTYSPSRAALLAKMKAFLPANLSNTYFCNSGAEANDAALKLARKITGRRKVISTLGGFHGRTFNTLSVTRNRENSGRYTPPQQDTVFVPFGCLESMANAIDEKTAAVIVEPIQGEGGVQIPSDNYLHEIKTLCHANEALLIVDEIQTGFCRTGKFFALEYSPLPVEPDFLTMGKGIAGGYPFAAFSVSATVNERIEKDDHGGTYCGNPLGCAISNAVIDVLTSEQVAEKVIQNGNYLISCLEELQATFPDFIKYVRGKGLLCALEFHDQSLPRPLTRNCAEKGLLVVPTRNGIIRLLPDLLVTRDNIDKAINVLSEVLASH